MDWVAAGSIITAVATVALVVVTWVNVGLVNRTLAQTVRLAESSFRPDLVVKCPQSPSFSFVAKAREDLRRMVASRIMNEGVGPALEVELRLEGGEWRLVTECLPRGGTAEAEELLPAEGFGTKIELRYKDLSGKPQPTTSWVHRQELDDWVAV